MGAKGQDENRWEWKRMGDLLSLPLSRMQKECKKESDRCIRPTPNKLLFELVLWKNAQLLSTQQSIELLD